MNQDIDLRVLYRPLQPLLLPAAQVAYHEFIPGKQVDRFIYCYWRLRTDSPLTHDFQYRVIADGCIDIFFEMSNPSKNFVMGLCNKYTEFSIGHTFDYVGIRFFPSAFPVLFHTDASALTGRFESLADVVPGISQFIADQFCPETTAFQICEKLDNYFTRLVSNSVFSQDHRFYAALEMIMKQNGMINVETDLDTGLSSRQLRRLFDRYIGDSPKTFSKIIRFQHVLARKLDPLTEFSIDEDYYDQAHYIKEFRHFSGLTPSATRY